MAKKKTTDSELSLDTASSSAKPAKRRAAPRKASSAAEAFGGSTTGDAVDTAPELTAATAGASSESSTPYTPTFDEISEAAYHRYLGRGGSHGHDVDDWVEAENQLRSRTRR